MRKLLGIGAVILGVVGVLLCVTAIGGGWWVAVRTADRIGRVAARLDQGLSEVDVRLGRLESRVNTVRSELNKVHEAAETIAAENPELPLVRAKIEELLDRVLPALDRAAAIADSLQSVAAGLRTGADIVQQITDDFEAAGVRKAADTIDLAAEALGRLPARVEAVKLARAVRLTRELVTLAKEAVAGSERLAEGLTAARQEIAVVRGRMAEWRDKAVFWVYVAATANTFIWAWGGLAQLCLLGWGRRQFSGRIARG